MLNFSGTGQSGGLGVLASSGNQGGGFSLGGGLPTALSSQYASPTIPSFNPNTGTTRFQEMYGNVSQQTPFQEQYNNTDIPLTRFQQMYAGDNANPLAGDPTRYYYGRYREIQSSPYGGTTSLPEGAVIHDDGYISIPALGGTVNDRAGTYNSIAGQFPLSYGSFISGPAELRIGEIGSPDFRLEQEPSNTGTNFNPDSGNSASWEQAQFGGLGTRGILSEDDARVGTHQASLGETLDPDVMRYIYGQYATGNDGLLARHPGYTLDDNGFISIPVPIQRPGDDIRSWPTLTGSGEIPIDYSSLISGTPELRLGKIGSDDFELLPEFRRKDAEYAGSTSWDGYNRGGMVRKGDRENPTGYMQGGIAGMDPGLALQQPMPQEAGPAMDIPTDPESEQLINAALIAIDPNSNMTEEDRQAILAYFDEVFGEGASDQLREEYMGHDEVDAKLTPGEVVVPKNKVLQAGQGNEEIGASNIMRVIDEMNALQGGAPAQALGGAGGIASALGGPQSLNDGGVVKKNPGKSVADAKYKELSDIEEKLFSLDPHPSKADRDDALGAFMNASNWDYRERLLNEGRDEEAMSSVVYEIKRRKEDAERREKYESYLEEREKNIKKLEALHKRTGGR